MSTPKEGGGGYLTAEGELQWKKRGCGGGGGGGGWNR